VFKEKSAETLDLIHPKKNSRPWFFEKNLCRLLSSSFQTFLQRRRWKLIEKGPKTHPKRRILSIDADDSTKGLNHENGAIIE